MKKKLPSGVEVSRSEATVILEKVVAEVKNAEAEVARAGVSVTAAAEAEA